ncbi:hypothetical protein ASG42_28500 [Rhizobium sp. Leaf391]|nr:hypothetical protein ASG42_28500 [Rhizobium sp. Leaf391]
MAGEVDRRVKNLLAMVQAVARQTFRTKDLTADAVEVGPAPSNSSDHRATDRTGHPVTHDYRDNRLTISTGELATASTRAKLTLSFASFERGTTDPEANALRRQP